MHDLCSVVTIEYACERGTPSIASGIAERSLHPHQNRAARAPTRSIVWRRPTSQRAQQCAGTQNPDEPIKVPIQITEQSRSAGAHSQSAGRCTPRRSLQSFSGSHIARTRASPAFGTNRSSVGEGARPAGCVRLSANIYSKTHPMHLLTIAALPMITLPLPSASSLATL